MTKYAIYNLVSKQYVNGTYIMNGAKQPQEDKAPLKVYTTEKRAEKGLEALASNIHTTLEKGGMVIDDETGRPLVKTRTGRLVVKAVKEPTDKDVILQLEAKLNAYRTFESEMSTIANKMGYNSRLDMATDLLDAKLEEADTMYYKPIN